MEQQFYSLLTQVGKAKLVNYHVLGKTLNLSKIQVGDGGDKKGKAVFPTEDDSKLVNLRWEGNINRIYVDNKNENYLSVEAFIPEDIGGWYITEFGIVDDEGDLVVIGGYPKTYKPKLTQGSGSSLYLKVLFEVSNAENVQLKVDPSVVMASQGFVFDQLDSHIKDNNPHNQYVKKEIYNSSQKLISTELSRLPIYPEVLNKEHRLTITDNGNGTITIDKGQVIRWRGHKDFPTESYTEAQRTFNIDNNKIYHLRWNPLKGFSLNDLEDSKYNPKKQSHINEDFDGDYDDILLVTLLPENDIYEIVSSDKTRPCFDSGWIKISAQAGKNSYKEAKHNLRRIPNRWVAQIKADGQEGNQGNIDAIYLSGFANTTDDDKEGKSYGGVVVAFTEKKFHISVPTKSNHSNEGTIVMLGDGWGVNSKGATMLKNVEIKVIGWY
ncbi:phage tail protein [Zooshikella marina]|uniref:Phage tail fibre protein N-terminal domain-containing protein n=1 Tax=Zooshikella ganghwensis TaxID=202772 RepID=A0A4P9VV53_9GAMM|nr:phage tail protein [Zooshikella ganghwensis]MBU2706065.1 phage tail protein [Zooshikella ganghwensis]RDH46314.1 hypothetical protein B9G39_24280 [Zooshikella ganghwensis]